MSSRLGRITRAELSTSTGISKPTISDAVRRLAARGVLVESGLQTGRRGRIATYYELAATSGWVLAIELDQDGLNTSSSSLAGDVFAESYRPVPPDATQLDPRPADRRQPRPTRGPEPRAAAGVVGVGLQLGGPEQERHHLAAQLRASPKA